MPIDLTRTDREIYEIYEKYAKYGADVRSMTGSAGRFAAKPAGATPLPP